MLGRGGRASSCQAGVPHPGRPFGRGLESVGDGGAWRKEVGGAGAGLEGVCGLHPAPPPACRESFILNPLLLLAPPPPRCWHGLISKRDKRVTHAHAADGNSRAPHIPVGWEGGHQRGRPHCSVCSGVRQEQLAPTPAFLFPSRGRRLGSLDFEFLVFSTAFLRALCWVRSRTCTGSFGVQKRWRRAHSPDLPYQGPALFPAPHKRGCPRAPCCQHRGLWWLLALGKPPGREDKREARGHLHHRIPVGSRDPVPGSLPGQGINSAGWAWRGTGLCGRRQQEQGTNCPSPVPPHPLGSAWLCAHACSPKGKCKSQGLFVTLIKPTCKRV